MGTLGSCPEKNKSLDQLLNELETKLKEVLDKLPSMDADRYWALMDLLDNANAKIDPYMQKFID